MPFFRLIQYSELLALRNGYRQGIPYTKIIKFYGTKYFVCV